MYKRSPYDLSNHSMKISLPNELKITADKKNPFLAIVEIFPLYPGYGHTVGNSLRRVLLSSLEGAGITAVKIKGAHHEFMTLPYIKEEVLEIILNLKQLNIKAYTDEKQEITLSVKGKKNVTASDFKKNSNVEIANTHQHIATLTHKDAELVIEATVEKGLGYSPVEEREKETIVGVISVDTMFSPIKAVGYTVEDIRVGKRTNFDKITFTIETNGTITVEEALNKATEILVQHFTFIKSNVEIVLSEGEKPKKKRAAK